MKIGEYEVVNLLGCGGASKVYLVYKGGDLTTRYVLKKFFPETPVTSKDGVEYLSTYETEKKCLEMIRDDPAGQCPYLPRLVDSGRDYLVTDYISSHNLFSVIEYASNEMILLIAKQLAQAIMACNNLGISTRDIKADNIVYCAKKKRIHLIDFGWAIIRGYGDSADPFYMCGTEGYNAPEMSARLKDLGSGLKYISSVRPSMENYAQNDVYQFGIIMCELLTRAPIPFNGYQDLCSDEEIVYATNYCFEGMNQEIPRDGDCKFPNRVREILESKRIYKGCPLIPLVMWCMELRANARPTMDKLYELLDKYVIAKSRFVSIHSL